MIDLDCPIPPLKDRLIPRLSINNISEICQRYAAGESSWQIQDAMGFSHSTVLGILNGGWLSDIPHREASGEWTWKRPAIRPTKKLDAGQCAEVRELYARGWLQREIAERFDIAQSQISRVLTGANHHDPGAVRYRRGRPVGATPLR